MIIYIESEKINITITIHKNFLNLYLEGGLTPIVERYFSYRRRVNGLFE